MSFITDKGPETFTCPELCLGIIDIVSTSNRVMTVYLVSIKSYNLLGICNMSDEF